MVNLKLIKTIALTLIALIILTTLVFFLDNTDYDKHSLNQKAFRQLENKHQDHFQEVLKKYDNYCLNRKDKSKLNTQQQFEEFRKGPCAPVILIPGLLGTILQVKIDCEKLQSNNPEIFSNCGWGTCSKYNIFKKRPAPEYRLWIGGIFSKTSFLQISKQDKCYGDLIGLFYNREKNILEGKEGLEVNWYGNTEQTIKDSKCGANSIRDFAEDIILKNALGCTSLGFGNPIDLLDAMGYQSGLTYQATPYDFRQDVAQSETQQIIPKAIDHLYELNGKKIVLLGHSLGNLHVLNSFSNISQETKDVKVKQFIAAGPPFLGTPKSFIAMLGGNPEYVKQILGKQLGMNYYTQISFTQGCSSSYDILIKDTFDKFKNKEWMKEIIRRIDYEETGYYEGSIPFEFLPNPHETCLNDVFKTRKGGFCQNGLVNLQKQTIVTINGEEFKATMEDIQKLIKKYSFYDIESAINLQNKSFEAEGLQNLINPNVPTSIVYSNMLKTDIFFTYNRDTLKVYNETKDFYFADKVQSGLGDGTVPTFSAIVPGLKWFYEHQQQKENSKPLKLVELCSNIKKENPFYDAISANGETEQTQSEYRGINCECENGDKQDICGHTCMINDSYFLDYFAQSVITFEKSSKMENKLTSEQLELLISSCPTLQQ